MVIDPSDATMDPEDHISFDVKLGKTMGLARAVNRSSQGRVTVEVLGLDSTFHRQRHAVQIREMMGRYCDLLEAQDEGNTDVVERHKVWFGKNLASTAPFSAVARAFARFYRLEALHGITVSVPQGQE